MNKNTLLGTIFCLIAGAVLLFGVPGLAVAADAETEDYILEDTIVTATKTGETKLQETPLAISVMETEQLEAGGMTSFADLELVVPGMKVQKLGLRASTVSLRGIGGTTSQYVGNSDAVGFYVDNAYAQRYTGMYAAVMDVDHVEVLRGPQGTLYGRNTSAGAVRIITRMPTDNFSGYVSAEYGSEDKYGFEGAFSGPIVEDRLKARLAFLWSSRDGYIRNVAPGAHDTVEDEDRFGARLKLQFTPSESVDFVLSAEYHDIESDGGEATSWADAAPFIAAGSLPFEPYESVAKNDIGNGFGNKNTVRNFSLDARFTLPRGLELRSTTAYGKTKWEMSPFQDVDGTTLDLLAGIQEMNLDAYSQEFNLTGKWGALTLLGGLFYIHEEEDTDQFLNIDLGVPVEVTRIDDLEGDSYAAYLSGTYALNEKLNVTAGVRYTDETKEVGLNNFTRVDLSALLGLPPGSFWSGAPFLREAEESWTDISPKFTVDYRVTDDAFLYASITRGYKAGGFDATATVVQPPFDEETVLSYEVGAKTDWFDRRLRANLTLFYNDYKDLQIKTFGVLPDGSWGTFVSNAGNSTIYGSELEITARPVKAFVLGTSVSYINSEYDDLTLPDPVTSDPVDASGNQLQAAPEWAVVAYATYSLPVMEYGFASFRMDYSWKDDVFSDGLNNEATKINAYGILNAQLKFETKDGKYFIDVYGKNLADKRYTSLKIIFAGLGGIPETVSIPTISPAPDVRRFGFRLGYRF